VRNRKAIRELVVDDEFYYTASKKVHRVVWRSAFKPVEIIVETDKGKKKTFSPMSDYWNKMVDLV